MKIGRNEPCPCGSGKKFKKCCGALGAYTRDERAEALMRLDHWIESFAGDARDEAHEEFWGTHVEYIDSLPEDLEALSDAAEDAWFAFDRDAETGKPAVDRFMSDADLSEGELTFLSACRRSSVRLYTVVGVVPGVSLTLRDAIEGGEITVHERMGSRSIGLYEHLAARVYERTSGAAGQPLVGYRRRAPERTVLHELVTRYAQTMIAELRDADGEGCGLPRYVERELAAYVRCGQLAHGFARVRCGACGDEIVVAFSCKRRGICPSCTARRMADTAAHLIDRVLPRAPYRQWVFTVPKLLRLRLARDPAWASWVGQLAVRAIGAWQRRIARARGVCAPLTGAVTFVQRFGGLVNLNVHFHLVVPDGVFVEDGDDLRFVMHPVPTNADVLAILDRIMRRVARRLANEAVEDVNDDAAPNVLAQVQAEAASTWRSPTDGKPTVRGAERLRAWCEGFSLHAGVVIADHDRDAHERLCRYGARPAFAQDRLAWMDDGRISYKLKRPWPDGRTHLVLEPVAFLRRLVGIIPPPRRHLVRYSGVFGPASKHRAKLRALVPATDADDAATSSCPGSASSSSNSSRARRLPWADLLRRVFADDVLQCPCGGRRSVIAIVADPTIARALLTALGLPNEPATFAPARDPPQVELAWDEAS